MVSTSGGAVSSEGDLKKSWRKRSLSCKAAEASKLGRFAMVKKVVDTLLRRTEVLES